MRREHELELLAQPDVGGAFALQPGRTAIRRVLEDRQKQFFQGPGPCVHWLSSNNVDAIHASGAANLSQIFFAFSDRAVASQARANVHSQYASALDTPSVAAA